jgi:hypothetical protein
MTAPLHLPVLLISMAAALAGCGAFKRAPVIEERVSDFGIPKIGVLATTGERRAVIVKIPERLICAEPPPDVAEAIASAVSGVLEASGKSSPADVKLGASSALSTALLQLTYRTQGLQLYRDGSFFLCILFINGIITPDEYLTARNQLLEDSLELIHKEIPLIAEIRKATATVTVAAGAAAASATAASGPSTSASAPGAGK